MEEPKAQETPSVLDEIALFSAAADEVLNNDENVATSSLASGLGSMLLTEWGVAEKDRLETEYRWLMDLRQYKGIYEADEEQRIGKDRSRSFARTTRVKVKTLDARMFDLLYPASNQDNWDLDRTPKPSVSNEHRARIIQALSAEGNQPTEGDIEAAINADMDARAGRMRTVIKDQLVEARIRRLAKKVLHSGHLFGCGIIKGPLVEHKNATRYTNTGDGWVMESVTKKVPLIEFMPVWRFYPSFSATELRDLPYVWDRMILSRASLQGIVQNMAGNVDVKAIKDYITANPAGAVETKHWEQELRVLGEAEKKVADTNAGMYEILSRWGYINAEDIVSSGLLGKDNVISEEDLYRTFFCNAWILPNGKLVKLVMYPYMTMEDVFHLYRIEEDETSILPEGLASILRDTQRDSNASRRMILDNGAICAGPQLEVNLKLLSKLVDPNTIKAFKLWFRNGTEPQYPAVREINFSSHLNELSLIKKMCDEEFDEVSALPRYMTGENAVSGAAGTARGMSMLMGAVGVIIKDLAGEYDEGITISLMQAMFKWNMRHSDDESIKGDFDISATASTSLVAKEVRTAELANFVSTIQPEERQYMKWYKSLSARIMAAELGSDIICSEDEASKIDADESGRELQDRMTSLQLEILEQNVKKISEQVADIKASRISKTVQTTYAAMQSGGVAATNPAAAAAGDEILRSAGWEDAHPQETTAQAMATPVDGAVPTEPIEEIARAVTPSSEVGSHVGMMSGFKTPEIEEGDKP